MALDDDSIGFAEIIGLNLVPARERSRGHQPLTKCGKRSLDSCLAQTDGETELLNELAVEGIEFASASVDRQCGNPVVNRIGERADEIVGWREPQAFGPREQRQTLEVGVGVTQDKVENDKTEEPIKVVPSVSLFRLTSAQNAFVGRAMVTTASPTSTGGPVMP